MCVAFATLTITIAHNRIHYYRILIIMIIRYFINSKHGMTIIIHGAKIKSSQKEKVNKQYYNI